MQYKINVASRASPLETNTVLRNTYALLGLTILFSALVAWVSMMLRLPHPGFLITLVGFYGLSYLTHRLSNSALGILAVFAFTGFLGYTLGPIIGSILQTTSNGYAILGTSLGATGTVFMALSAYVITTKQDMSYLGGMLFVTSIVAIIAAFASFLFQMPALSIVVSSLFALVSSGYILFHTSQIIHGGEKNYIIATISLFVSIYNLFLSLLRIFVLFSGHRD